MTKAPYEIPRTIGEALSMKAELGARARWLAGGTAMQLAWHNGEPDHPVIDISQLDLGEGVALADGYLRLSPNATLEMIRRDPIVAKNLPALAEAASAVAAPGVRHLATLGGNLLWGAGDLVPLFLALSAMVVAPDGSITTLAERLATSRDLLAVAVHLPLPAGRIAFEKIGRRAAFSPSLVTVSGADTPDGLRCAVGGGPVPPQVFCLADEPTVAALETLIEAPDDSFASGNYRRRAAARVLAMRLSANDR